MTKPSAKAGEQITCTNGHVVCEVIEDIFAGDVDYARKLGNWRQPIPFIGSQPVCAVCGAKFYTGAIVFHFADGWRKAEGTTLE